MPDSEYTRLLQAAKEKAQFGFLAAMQRAIEDAENNVLRLQMDATSGADRTVLISASHFLRQEGSVFLRRIDALFRGYLDRAMQTMYIDLRPGMRQLGADELTLIDDEIVNRQIEVGRLAERMRDANEESVGRLNVIVARLHGEREARERENPFRPYLLARALHEAIREIASDEPKAKTLFAHVSTALIQYLPGYYSAIREVFESSGMHGKFVLQRSKEAHRQYYSTSQLDAINARMMPGLQRVLATLQDMPETAQAGSRPGTEPKVPKLEDFIRSMFHVGQASGRSSPVPADSLMDQLTRCQHTAGHNAEAAGRGDEAIAMPRPSGLREQIDLDQASTMERMTVDVVAMLFEFILNDEHIPAELRAHIGLLQAPIVKAALLEPILMQEERHPARQLLNRLGTAAIASDRNSPAGQKLAEEIRRVVLGICDGFDQDMAIFSRSLQQFERFLADHLRKDDKQTANGIEAVEAAEKFSILLTNITKSLCDVLLPLNVDKRISDFIIAVWPHVLVNAAWQDAEANMAPGQPESLFQRFRAVLPELLWSITEKSDAQQRSALIRLLPDLVKRFRQALQLIQLPDDESRAILDLLVNMHTQTLRGTQKRSTNPQSGLEELKEDFSRLTINWAKVTWGMSDPPQPRTAVIEEVFAKRAVAAELRIDARSSGVPQADREFLAQTYLLGTRVAFRSEGAEEEGASTGQLVWASSHRSLYLFRRDKSARLVLYTYATLLEALSDETLLPLEYAPVFERAVESLLFGAENLQSSAS